MINSIITQTSPHGSFVTKQLLPNLYIVEDVTDRHNWGNGTEDKPPFIAYIACRDQLDMKIWVENLSKHYRIELVESRKPRRGNKELPLELKVRGLARRTKASIVFCPGTPVITMFGLNDLANNVELYYELTNSDSDEETRRMWANDWPSKVTELHRIQLVSEKLDEIQKWVDDHGPINF